MDTIHCLLTDKIICSGPFVCSKPINFMFSILVNVIIDTIVHEHGHYISAKIMYPKAILRMHLLTILPRVEISPYCKKKYYDIIMFLSGSMASYVCILLRYKLGLISKNLMLMCMFLESINMIPLRIPFTAIRSDMLQVLNTMGILDTSMHTALMLLLFIVMIIIAGSEYINLDIVWRYSVIGCVLSYILFYRKRVSHN